MAFELAFVITAPTDVDRLGALRFWRLLKISLQYWELDEASI
jgi:hypothetical protein